MREFPRRRAIGSNRQVPGPLAGADEHRLGAMGQFFAVACREREEERCLALFTLQAPYPNVGMGCAEGNLRLVDADFAFGVQAQDHLPNIEVRRPEPRGITEEGCFIGGYCRATALRGLPLTSVSHGMV